MSSRNVFSSASLWSMGTVEIQSKRRKRFESNGGNVSRMVIMYHCHIGVTFRNYSIDVHSHCFPCEY